MVYEPEEDPVDWNDVTKTTCCSKPYLTQNEIKNVTASNLAQGLAPNMATMPNSGQRGTSSGGPAKEKQVGLYSPLTLDGYSSTGNINTGLGLALRAGTPQGFSSNRAPNGEATGFLAPGSQNKKRGKMLTGNFYSPNIERQKMGSPLSNNNKFGNTHAASVSPNSQESKTGGSNQQPLVYSKDILNGYQQRLQKFATFDNSKTTQDVKKASQNMNLVMQTTKENFSPNQEFRPSSPIGTTENLRTTAGSNSLFSGVQSAKMFHSPQLGKQTFGGQISSNRYREPLKPLSPQFDKQKTAGNMGSEASSENDNSYIKRMKQALQEKTGSPGSRQESPKPAKESSGSPSDIFSLRKLKEMTSGKLINSNLTGSPLLTQQKDQSSLSANQMGESGSQNPDHSQKHLKSAMILNFNSGPLMNNESTPGASPLLGLHSTQPSLLSSGFPQGQTPKSPSLLVPNSLRPASQTPRAPGVLVPRDQTDTSTNSLSATTLTKDRSSSRTPSQTPAVQTGNFLLMQPAGAQLRATEKQEKDQREKGSANAMLSNLFTTLMSSQPQVVMATGQTSSESQSGDVDQALEVNLEAVKLIKLKFLAAAQAAVLNVCKLILEDRQDPYEAIRAYSEIAQDAQFNIIEVDILTNLVVAQERRTETSIFTFDETRKVHDRLPLLLHCPSRRTRKRRGQQPHVRDCWVS